MKQKFVVIGINDCREPDFPVNIQIKISQGKVFSGGLRHHDIVRRFLPEEHVWIDITVPLDDVFEKYANCSEVIVFASGDPLFYGFANTIRRRLPDAEIEVFPYLNSVQMLANHYLLPYSSARFVSLTGRDWKLFDAALIRGEKMIGILTDRHKTPITIAQRMIHYGYTNYKMYVGEMMGNVKQERYRVLTIEEASTLEDIQHPNTIILERTEQHPHPLGIPEDKFSLLNGRASMITKMPIRLLTISMLNLDTKQSFWDVGFCTGSVSIEAQLQYPELSITSFEVREEGLQLMNDNTQRFGTPGITTVIGDFMTLDISVYPKPDAVFIGGHNGKLVEMLQRLSSVLLPGGVIVFNSVTQSSYDMFFEGIERANLTFLGETHITIDNHNPITILKAQK